MEAKLSERSRGASRELSLLPFRDRAEVVSRNRGPASSNCFHVDPSLHRHLDPAFAARSGARRPIVRRRHQKNPFHADTNAEAAKEEERVSDEEEVADTVAESIKKAVAGTGERITDAIGDSIAEKEGKFVHGRGIGVAVAQPEEENNLAHAFANGLAASKEKDFANAGAG
jgi:DNA mismatch repair ATPase MutL